MNMLNRRNFLRTGLAVAGAIGVPYFIPGKCLGKDGTVAPSEQITLAGIGIRHRGGYVLNFMLEQPDVRFLAVADVRADCRESVSQKVDDLYKTKDCAKYRDFRKLLERKDIDTVLIATGDRWHTMASILAAKAGKDVYSEKPCCMTIGQCQALDKTMRQFGTVFQAGTQRRSVDNFRFAAELAKSGKLGKIHTVHASIYHLSNRYDWLPGEPEPDPEVVDWNMWLGPAPWRPYNSAYVNGAWRGHDDFDSGAKLLDWGAHTVDLCQWAVTNDDTVPIEYEADGGTIYAKYENGIKLVMRPDGWLGLGTCPIRIEGEDGWLETGDSGKTTVSPDSLRSELRSSNNLDGLSPRQHVRNFFDCVKTRAQPVCNASVVRRSHTACLAAALSWILKRKLRFDPVKEEFINDEKANRMRHHAMREPWGI